MKKLNVFIVVVLMCLLLVGTVCADRPIKAAFKTDVKEGLAPLTVHFTESSNNKDIVEWNWEFGDGTKSTEQNPTHVFEGVGKYNVVLTVGDGVKEDKLADTHPSMDTASAVIYVPKYDLKANQKTTGKVSDVTLSGGDVTIKDKKTGLSASSYTVVDGMKFTPGSSKSENGKVTLESSERTAPLFGSPVITINYEFTGTKLKEEIILQSDKKITIPLSIPVGYHLMAFSEGGYRIVKDGSDRWWDGIGIQKPFGIDATGKYIDMKYTWNKKELSLVYKKEGITYPLTIDPSYVINGITYNYVHPNTFYSSANGSQVVRYTIHNNANAAAVNTSTDLWLGANIKANFSDIRWMSEDATMELPAYANVINETMAEVLVTANIQTTGTTINTFFNSTSGLSNWTLSSVIKTPYAYPYYSVDEWRNYSYNGITEIPVSQSFQDLFGSDTTFRYANASATTGANWVASAPTDAVVAGGVLTLASNDDMAVSARLKSYKFAGGEFEFSFDNNNDGGATTDLNGVILTAQDLSNHYRITVGNDTVAGSSNISIWNNAGGTYTLVNTTDTNTTYTRGNKNWVKIKFDPITNYTAIWVRDDAGAYTAAPLLINRTMGMFEYGYIGFYSYVDTLGAGNLNTYFDDLTIKAESIVGYTNIPIGGGRYKPMLRGAQIGEYWDGTQVVPATRFVDDFNWDSSSEYTLYRWEIDTTNGALKPSAVYGYGSSTLSNNKYGDGRISFTFVRPSTTPAVNGNIHFVFGAQETHANNNGFSTSANDLNGYVILLNQYSQALLYRSVAGASAYTTYTNCYLDGLVDGNKYTINIIRSGATITLSCPETGQSCSYTDGTPYTYGYVEVFREYYPSGEDHSQSRFTSININALSSDSTNGISATLGGVPHGARYDTNEYSGVAWTDTVASALNFQNLTIPTKSTNSTYDQTQNILWFYDTNGDTMSYETVATNRAFNTIGNSPTARNLSGFDHEGLLLNGNTHYISMVNYSKWVGTQYDDRHGTVFAYPAIYPSTYTLTAPNGSVWANFTANITEGKLYLPVVFNDTSEQDPAYPITVWNWSLGNGDYSSLQHPVKTYGVAGLYTISLNVSNDLMHDVLTKIEYINVTEAFIVNFSGTPTSFSCPHNVYNPGVCEGTIAFTDTTWGTPNMWNWSFGDGSWFNTTTDASKNPSHKYSMVGTYDVGLIVKNTTLNATLPYSLTKSSYIQIAESPTGGGIGYSIANDMPGMLLYISAMIILAIFVTVLMMWYRPKNW